MLLLWGFGAPASLSGIPTLADSPYNDLERDVPGTPGYMLKHEPIFYSSAVIKTSSQSVPLGLLKRVSLSKDGIGLASPFPEEQNLKFCFCGKLHPKEVLNEPL